MEGVATSHMSSEEDGRSESQLALGEVRRREQLVEKFLSLSLSLPRAGAVQSRHWRGDTEVPGCAEAGEARVRDHCFQCQRAPEGHQDTGESGRGGWSNNRIYSK